MATILAFDRKCSTWCAVQYLPLQGLRQCYINLWRTWGSLRSRRCNTYTRWDKNQMRILIFMILILFIGISFSEWGNRWAPLSPVRSLSYSWHLHLHQLLFRYIEGGGNSPNQTLSSLMTLIIWFNGCASRALSCSHRQGGERWRIWNSLSLRRCWSSTSEVRNEPEYS